MSKQSDNTGIRDMSDLLGAGGGDAQNSAISIMGYTPPIPPALAQFVKPLYNQFLKKIATEGGKVAFQKGYDASKTVGASNQVAYGVARTAEFLWQFGPTITDTGLNIRTSLVNGYTEAHEARALLAPYLAANHNMSTSMAALMKDSNSGVKNARLYIMDKSLNSLKANFAQFAGMLPSLVLILWQRKLDDIDNPERVRNAYGEGDGAAADARVAALKKLNEPNTKAENNLMGRLDKLSAETIQDEDYQKWLGRNQNGNPIQYLIQNNIGRIWGELQKIWNDHQKSGNTKALISDLFAQVVKPKHANELELNLRAFGGAPLVGGAITQFIGERLVKPDEGKTLDNFAVIRAAKLAKSIKQNPDIEQRDLSEDIYRLFQVHFENCGNTKTISQSNAKKLTKICEELSEAVVIQGLNPYALIDLVCGDEMVKYSKGEFIFTPAHEREELVKKEFAKYTDKVDNKEFYKDVGVKPQELAKLITTLQSPEREFLIMLCPPGIQQQAGIDKRELAKLRRASRDEFIRELAQGLSSLKDMSSEDLKEKYGIPEEAAKLLLSVADDFSEAAQYGGREAEGYLVKNQRNIAKAVAKAGLASKGPDFWQKMVGKGQDQAESQESGMGDEGRDQFFGGGPDRVMHGPESLNHVSRVRRGQERDRVGAHKE